MKYIKADLLDDVVSVYDQTKTTIQGRVASKVINTVPVLGPPLSKFIDVFTDTAQTPAGIYCTDNGRLFVLATPVNGTSYDTLPVLLYDFNTTTGAHAYVGRINVSLPNLVAAVHTIRSFKVIDTGTTGWKLFITTTATGSIINGGTFLANNIDKADFIPIGSPTIAMATSSGAKAVYFLQDSANLGVSHSNSNTASAGSVLDIAGSRIYVHNGTAATHQYFVFDTATSPTWSSASVSVSVASPGVVTDAGHSYLANDIVIFSAGTLPTGLTVGLPYFVRNPVAGTSYELSLTSGGASINTTGSPSTGAVLGRAWGTTGSNWVHKTGNLPALTGTLLLNDSEDYATPVSSPVNGGVLNGTTCAALATTSNLYLGKLSELTSGATTWPSLSTAPITETPSGITAPAATYFAWSNLLDAGTYSTNTSKFISKQLHLTAIRHKTGALSNEYYEGFVLDTAGLGLVTVVGMDHAGGWLLVAGGTTGQRGVIAVDYSSDQFYDSSFIVTKVLDNPNSQLKFYTSLEQLWDYTGNMKLQYRTSGFGSISGGWIDVPVAEDLTGLVITSNEIQFKLLFGILEEGAETPAQLSELIAGVDPNNGISDNWEFSDDFSDNNVPSRSCFRLKMDYDSVVPTLYFRAYDLSDALLINHNTVTNAANFEYSTTNGVSWLPLGTIPNTVGTLVRYTFTSPPGVDIRPGLKND
jgi:hypothetical protein